MLLTLSSPLIAEAKETERGGREAEMSAHSIQCCVGRHGQSQHWIERADISDSDTFPPLLISLVGAFYHRHQTIQWRQCTDRDQSPTLSLLSIHHPISPTPFRRYCHLVYSDWASYERIDVTLVKETVRGWSVAEMSAHSIQRCDWPTWLWRAKTANHSAELSGPTFRARTANHSAESSGPTFRLLFLLSRFSWQKHYQSITGGRRFVPFFVSWVIITVLIYQF